MPERRQVRLSVRGNDLLVASGGEEGDFSSDAAGLTAALRDAASDASSSALVYDGRLGAYRLLASSYRAIRERLEKDHYAVTLGFDPTPSLPFTPSLAQSPREYQQSAILRWQEAGNRGVVVLPTGAGKTLVALLAIQQTPVWTLILVPTLDLLGQWRRALLTTLGAPPEHVSTFGGGKRDVGPITIMTYDSAAIHTRQLTRFGLLIFDEVHHLPAASYRRGRRGTLSLGTLGHARALGRSRS
ncbi:MAG TPA: DEAD/DEAH box helicase family protein [Chloroflexota bacterium]|nr:DEAD/DEAH box helicase family protein [Chloroflexota bacterium]